MATDKQRWIPGARALFARMTNDKVPYTISVLGKTIPVLPNVFSPKHFPDAIPFAEEVPKIVGNRSFLEIGTGTGMIALFVAFNGSRHVAATDISKDAVENAKQTFSLHKLEIAVYQSDVYSNIPRKENFDVIFWNHPFHYADDEPDTDLLKAGFDYQYKSLRAFFSGAQEYLNKNGQILLGTGNMARLFEIEKIAKENGYRSSIIWKARVPDQEGSEGERENY